MTTANSDIHDLTDSSASRGTEERAYPPNKFAVTGSTGLVGSHLVAELIRSGFSEITLPVRSRTSLDKLYTTLAREGINISDTRFHVIETQLNNPVEMAEVFVGIDTVFNCAAAVSLGGTDRQTLIQTNVEITQHVVDAALRCGVRQLVHVSSIATLGEPHEGMKYRDETTAMESLTGASGYAASKFLCEAEIMRAAESGIRTVIVNPAPILGAGDGSSGSAMIIPLLARGLDTYTEGVTAYVDVRDVALAMVLLSQCEAAAGQRFVLAADNISYRQLIGYANKALGKRSPRIKLGKTALNILKAANALHSGMTGDKPRLTAELAGHLTAKYYYRGEKIARVCAFGYTPVEQTVTRLIRQYKEEHNG